MLSLADLYEAAREDKDPYPKRIAIDPGETTGICAFVACNLIEATQLRTPTIDRKSIDLLTSFIKNHKPSILVVESYRVFQWKTEDHAWADLHTPRLIGCIETLATLWEIPLIFQTPQVAKNFCTDEKLKQWDLWIKGQRHARDSIRHACHHILFGK